MEGKDFQESADLEKINPELLRDMPPEVARKVTRIVAEAYTFQGPLPPPLMLEAYNQLIPNGADRFMKLVENQSEHRRRQESKLVSGRLSLDHCGLALAFLLGVIVIFAGIYLAMNGHQASSLAMVGTLVPVLIILALKKKPQREAVQNKPARVSGPRPAPKKSKR